MIASELLGREDGVISPHELLSALLVVLSAWLFILSCITKARLALWGFWYFLASGDKKTEKPKDEHFNYKGCKRRTVIFIRHGESEWNQIFNKGNPLFRPLKLIRGLIKEAFLLFDQESLFMDSPLSSVGIQQAWDLLTFLASQPEGCQEGRAPDQPVKELEVADIVSIIRGDVGKSLVVSSILRRAISTGILGLSTRLLKTEPSDKIAVMTCLQEISRNVDTLALTPARSPPQVPAGEAAMKHMGDLVSFFYRKRLNYDHNKGNKTLELKAKDRQQEFTHWLHKQDKLDAIIVCGHSFYFREFFRSYLPKASKHQAKTLKMANCGCVAFDLYMSSPTKIQIDEQSIKPVYLGFEEKGKKKKDKVH